MPDLSLRYPPSVLDARAQAQAAGSFRDRVRFDLVERPHHACGLLAAADLARFCGVDAIVAIEFGVAEGAGLLNLSSVAREVARETGVEIEIVGFDSGAGLPAPVDYRDHREIWTEGDFRLPDIGRLRQALPDDTELVLGPVAQTVPAFVDALTGRVVGFVSFDVDFYSSTAEALRLFEARPDCLLPVVVSHFDDVLGGPGRIGSLFRTRSAGQLLAIDEFNSGHALRNLDPMRILRHRRPFDRELWLERMYGLHVLDHPLRNGQRARPPMSMTEHSQAAGLDWLP